MDSDKISSIAKACKITEEIFSQVVAKFSDFSSEKDVSRFISAKTNGQGLKPAFPTIVGSGPGGSEPHHKPILPLTNGFCVIDFGVKVNGYCSDFTRTVFLGTPAKKDLELYSLVLDAQTAGKNLVKAASPAIAPYEAACTALGSEVSHFVHGLGHGVAKRIHVKPYLKKTSADTLKENDVVTVEPGLYYKNEFGIRIEDVFVVTISGAKPLTFFDRSLIVIPFQ
ncbi:MAG: M24 family metallopeptidase [archaeon]|nr:M24 family metallopeptidase [archaeon]